MSPHTVCAHLHAMSSIQEQENRFIRPKGDSGIPVQFPDHRLLSTEPTTAHISKSYVYHNQSAVVKGTIVVSPPKILSLNWF